MDLNDDLVIILLSPDRQAQGCLTVWITSTIFLWAFDLNLNNIVMSLAGVEHSFLGRFLVST